MTSLVPSIAEVLMKKIALWISNRGNDWPAESAMIASNELLTFNVRLRHTYSTITVTQDHHCKAQHDRNSSNVFLYRPKCSACKISWGDILHFLELTLRVCCVSTHPRLTHCPSGDSTHIFVVPSGVNLTCGVAPSYGRSPFFLCAMNCSWSRTTVWRYKHQHQYTQIKWSMRSIKDWIS